MRENNIADIEAAEELLRQTMAPCDFARTTVSLNSGEGTNDETILQFNPQQIGERFGPDRYFITGRLMSWRIV